MTPARRALQNICHDSTEFFWFRLARPFRRQDLARSLRRPRQQMERQRLVVRIAFFFFVVPLGYVYYLGAQNMPDPSAR